MNDILVFTRNDGNRYEIPYCNVLGIDTTYYCDAGPKKTIYTQFKLDGISVEVGYKEWQYSQSEFDKVTLVNNE